MAVNNSLQEKPVKNAEVEYVSNGEKVKLSSNIIRKYLVSGGGNVTEEEVRMFLSLCKYQHLNPFLREAYLVKYGDSQPATMVVGKDVFLKRARRQADFAGLQAGVIVLNDKGEIVEREGTFVLQGSEQLVGGWAKVYVKGYVQPFYESVSLVEYIGKKKSGEVNGQWSGKPATMIRKVALAHALKEAFPEENAGLYAPEEMEQTQAVVLDETPLQQPAEGMIIEPEAVKAEKVEQKAEDVQSALFGEDF